MCDKIRNDHIPAKDKYWRTSWSADQFCQFKVQLSKTILRQSNYQEVWELKTKKLAPVGNRKWKSNNDFGFKRKEIDCGTQLWAELSKFIALLELPLRRSSAPTGVIRFSPYFSPKVELLQSYTAGSDVGHAGFKGFQRSVLPKLVDSWEPWIMTITVT